MTLDNVNASYDTSTGNLTGTIIVNIFSMSGTERTYTEPDAGSVAYGTDNIFGTVEQNAPAEASDQNTDTQNTDAQNADAQSAEAQADTAETEAQPAQ